MELILIKPLRKFGTIGQLIKVKNGFGRNWLIPQGIAIRATENNKKLIENQKIELEEKNAKAKTEAESIAKVIDQKELIFIRQSAEDGRLFGSVSNKEIAKELSKIASYEIPYSSIILNASIKSLGISFVEVLLHTDVTLVVKVIVARSETEAQEMIRTFKASETQSSKEDATEI